MKTRIYHLLLITFIALFCATSCQDEVVAIDNPSEQETITANSPLFSFMTNVTANYGSYDDFLDDASCFSIELPVTIIIADVTLTIETLEDLEELEDLFEEFDDIDDLFDFVFPITIILSDYTEIVIENEEQLFDFVNQCEDEEDDDIIECIDFVYPISFSVFNAEFDFVDTIVIQSDEALFEFLEELADEDNVLIVSLDYPVTLIYANGDTVEVNSNEELANAIQAAEDDCDDDYECEIELEAIESYLLECVFDVEIENDEDDLVDTLQFNFTQSGELIVTGDATVVDAGAWDLLETDLGIKLVIEGLQTFTVANGLWLLEGCDDDYELEFVQESENGLLYMDLELNCDVEEDEVFDCFGDFELVECLGPNLEAEFNLVADTIGLIDCPFDFIPSFHETQADAEANTNAIENTESYWSEGGQVYLRIESASGNFEIFTIYLNTEECNYFECFGNYDLAVCDEDDGSDDGLGLFDLNLIFDNCNTDDTEYVFYTTLVDAENQVNPLASPYVNIVNPQEIYSRVSLAGNPSVFEIFVHTLIVEDCNQNAECSEEDVDEYLSECEWKPVNYNGSDNLADWRFNFDLSSQTVVVYDNETTITAMWSTSQSEDGVIVELLNVAGPNIQALNGEWLVVECSDEFFHLERGDDILLFERICD